jgi:tetratricopeptide (TPR) repeat protein
VTRWRSLGLEPGGLILATAHLGLAALLAPTGLFSKYPNLAAGLARGTLSGAQVGDASPLYLLLNLGLSPDALRWLQWAAAGLSVVVLFQHLHRRAGPLAAWVGSTLLALSQSWLVYGAVLEPDLLIGVALLLAVTSLSRPSSPASLAGAAVALGLATSLRPTALVFAAFVLMRLLAQRAPLRWLAPAAAAFVVTALAPSALLRLGARFDVRGTMSAGQVFHQSHRPESVGFGAVFPSLLKVVEAQASRAPHPPDYAHELYREMARASDPSRASDAATERYWLERSLAFFRQAPAAALRQELDKLVFFLAPPVGEYDIPAVRPLLARPSGLPLRWLALLAAGSLLGHLFGRARREVADVTDAWLLQWLAALATGLLFYAHGRYLVGLVPALAGLTGLGVAAVLESRGRPGLRGLGALALGLPLLLLALPGVRRADRMVERIAAFDALATSPAPSGADAWEAARARYLDEQAAFPDVFWPTAPRGAGLLADEPETARLAAEKAEAQYGTASPVDATLAAGLWAAAGRCDRALALTESARASGFWWANGDSLVDPRALASDCLLALGRRAEAVAELEAAALAAPGRLEVLARLVAAGDTGTATDVARWEAELFALHDAASARYALARARRRWGDPQGALADADWLASHWPAAAPFAELERALALVSLQRPGEAVEAWSRSLVLAAPVHGLSSLDALVAQLSAESGEPSVAALALAHWRLRGRREEARAVLAAHPELAKPRP